jgi:hypothetical protein
MGGCGTRQVNAEVISFMVLSDANQYEKVPMNHSLSRDEKVTNLTEAVVTIEISCRFIWQAV